MSAALQIPDDDDDDFTSVDPSHSASPENTVPRSASAQSSIVPNGWRPRVSEPVPVVRCTTIKRDGERCRRWSLRGTTVCIVHGGQLPVVQEHANAVVEAARLRLVGLTDLAIDQIEDLLENASQDAIRLKAAQDVLDRAGVRGAIEVEVTHTQEVTAAERVNIRLQQIKERMAPREEEEPIDAEIVEDGADEDGS